MGKAREETVVRSDGTADLLDAYLAATSDEALMPGTTGDDAYGLEQVAVRGAGIDRVSPNAPRDTACWARPGPGAGGA